MDEAELTTRLIRAENELQSLKTAHSRGLGSIQVYSQDIYVTKGATAAPVWCDIVFTINIKSSAEPFPLLKMYPQLTKVFVGIYYINTFTVSSDGYTVKLSAEAVLPSTAANIPVRLVSTSEINSVTYQIIEEQ